MPPRELAIALVVTAAMSADVHQSARPVLALIAVVLAGLSLAWRLRAPLLPLVLILAVNFAVLATPQGRYGPQTVIFGVLLAVFTAAERLTGRWAVLAAVLSIVGIWGAHVVTAEGDAADFWPFLVWAVPWLAGRMVRQQTLRAQEAGARAALFEVEAAQAAAREREHIARELHDVVAHSVSLIVVQAGAERLALTPEQARTRTALQAIETTGRQALSELRTMLGVLGGNEEADERRPQPSLESVPDLVDSVRAAGLDVTLEMSESRPIPPGVGLVAYRIVQESLTNALRHGAGRATVVVRSDDSLEVEVSNRIGTPRPGAGRGIDGMRQRVELFGGSLEAGERGADWVVTATVPLGVAVTT